MPRALEPRVAISVAPRGTTVKRAPPRVPRSNTFLHNSPVWTSAFAEKFPNFRCHRTLACRIQLGRSEEGRQSNVDSSSRRARQATAGAQGYRNGERGRTAGGSEPDFRPPAGGDDYLRLPRRPASVPRARPGLARRGHEPIIATSESYRAKVETLGLGFRPVRPDVTVIESDPELMRRLMDLRRGTERIVCEFVMPALRDSYEDTLAASAGADLLIGHVITYATRLVAEKQRIPWASVTLSPIGFFSAHDPPVLPGAEYLRWLRFMGPTLHRPLLGLAKWSVRAWGRPWHRLRAEVGLPAVRDHPLFEALFSPRLVLAMFSPWLADRQPDWPTQTVLAGFPFHERDHEAGLPGELDRFLDDGPPPIVFALGSSAVWDAGTFFQDSAAAAAKLGRRAVLVIGRDSRNRLASLPPGICAVDYAPYAALFPRAAAIVHQGGVGTTAQAMRGSADAGGALLA